MTLRESVDSPTLPFNVGDKVRFRGKDAEVTYTNPKTGTVQVLQEGLTWTLNNLDELERVARSPPVFKAGDRVEHKTIRLKGTVIGLRKSPPSVEVGWDNREGFELFPLITAHLDLEHVPPAPEDAKPSRVAGMFFKDDIVEWDHGSAVRYGRVERVLPLLKRCDVRVGFDPNDLVSKQEKDLRLSKMTPGQLQEHLVDRAKAQVKENVAATKDTNPKQAFADTKAPISAVPGPVVYELGLALLEGALKYGRHNWRVSGVRASTYFDAAMRHLWAWWEGEDVDPDSGISHLVKAMACLAVVRDAQHHQKCNDDRPPKSPAEFLRIANEESVRLREKYPNPKPPHTEKP